MLKIIFNSILSIFQINKKYKRIHNKFLKVVLQPGVFQLFSGVVVVLTFILISLYVNDYEDWITEKRGSPLRLKFVNEPPGIIFFQNL